MQAKIELLLHPAGKTCKVRKNSCTFELILKKKQMYLKNFLEVLNDMAPFQLQESYDNSGVQVGSPGQEVSKALICLDLTLPVVYEAIKNECDLILCHHPLIFKGITKVSDEHPTGKIIIEAIRHGIAIVAVHTNLDNVYHGVNYELGQRLGLTNLKILQPAGSLLKKLVTFCPLSHAEKVRASVFEAGAGQIGDYDCCSFNLEGEGSFRAGDNTNPFTGKIQELHYEPEVRIETIFPVYLQARILSAMLAAHPYEEVAYDIYQLDNAFDRAGSGMIGDYDKPLTVKEFLNSAKNTLGVPFVRHANYDKGEICRVAICGGSGSFLMQQAIRSGAQAFVTADVKYHQFFDAHDKILLVDAGHFETEQFTKDLLYSQLKKKIANFALLVTETNTNPVNYF